MKPNEPVATNEQAAYWCNLARQATEDETPTESPEGSTFPNQERCREVSGSGVAKPTPIQIRRERHNRWWTLY